MRVTFIGEGTYPYSHGGVSVWCDQMIQGMPEHEFGVVSLTAAGDEPLAWELPANVHDVRNVPMWGPAPEGRTPRGRTAREARLVCLALLDALTALDEQAAVVKMTVALRDWAVLAQRYRIEDVLVSDACVEHLMNRWHENGPASVPDGWPVAPSLADAVAAIRMLSHWLRPLSARAPRADVIHLVANGLSGLVALCAYWEHGTPFVLSEHGVYLRERYLAMRDTPSWVVKVFALQFFRLLTTVVYWHAAMIAPGNLYNSRWEVHQGTREASIRTVYNGVDPETFGQAGPPPAVPTVAWVGRIDPLKDLETLVRGFALVVEKVPAARLRIFGATPAGNEWYAQRVRDLVSTLGIEASVTLEGRVDRIQDAYASGSVVALTSISEGFPYTVIEAMSSARATVSTDVGGVREAVGDAGIVVPPREPAALADGLLKILGDDRLRDELGVNARRRVLEMFTLERSLEIFRSIYLGIAAENEVSPENSAAPGRVVVAV